MTSFAVLLFVVLTSVVQAPIIDVDALTKALSKPLIDPELSMKQAQIFTKAKIARFPQLATADGWQTYADQLRKRILNEIVFRGEAAQWRKNPTRVEWLDTIPGGPGYSIRKLRYEVLPGLWVPALLYKPDVMPEKTPVVLNVNGHDADGKQAPYKQIRCINQAKRGMLALNVEWFNMGQLATENFNHYRMNQIDLCGTSGLAPFVLSMMRGLDVLLSLPNADPSRVAVAGLSGGGWQTIVISSLDTRVTLADPVAGYGSWHSNVMNGDLGDSEQTPSDLGTLADYAHLTAMRAPRPTLLTYNFADNCCYKAENALPPLLEAARPVYRLFEQESNLRWHVNYDPGDHNFQQDNRVALYFMFRDFFYPNDPNFNPEEIPSEAEIKTKPELAVELPSDNLDFHQIALKLSENLPENANFPREESNIENWQSVRRGTLRSLVRFGRIYPLLDSRFRSEKVDDILTAEAKRFAVHEQLLSSEAMDGMNAEFLRLHLGEDWTIPVVKLTRGHHRKTTILIGDNGRKELAAHAARLLESGQRVLAVDPFNFGESRIVKTPFLFDLFVAAVGERSLGLQASQIATVAQWAERTFDGPVRLEAVGPRSSVFALIAAAVEPRIKEVTTHQSLGSLKEVIERNWSVPESAELFCFGLLKSFDIPQIVALIAPRPVHIVDPSDRCRKELAPLGGFYQQLGSKHELFVKSEKSE